MHGNESQPWLVVLDHSGMVFYPGSLQSSAGRTIHCFAYLLPWFQLQSSAGRAIHCFAYFLCWFTPVHAVQGKTCTESAWFPSLAPGDRILIYIPVTTPAQQSLPYSSRVSSAVFLVFWPPFWKLGLKFCSKRENLMYTIQQNNPEILALLSTLIYIKNC